MSRSLLVILVAFLAPSCSAPNASSSDPVNGLPEPDRFEQEPNDEHPQALGVIRPTLVVGGTMDECGADGSFEGSDVDRFSFSVGQPEAIDLYLTVHGGDLDLLLYNPQGELMADEHQASAHGEALQFSIGPDAEYEVELRCWMGDEPGWRLVFEQGAEQ
jgi:hypothetical protein